MASHSFSAPSSPDRLHAISRSHWDEPFDNSLLHNDSATERALEFDPEGPIEDTLLGEDGWGFVGYDDPWALGEDWLEDGPSIMKAADPLRSTRAEFGRDVSNVLHAAPSPVKSRATESDDEDDAEWSSSDEDLEDLVAAYGSKPEDHENVDEEASELAFEDDGEDEDDDCDDYEGEEDSDDEDDGDEDDDDNDNDDNDNDDNDDDHASLECGIAVDCRDKCATSILEDVVDGDALRSTVPPSVDAIPNFVSSPTQDLGGEDDAVFVPDPALVARPPSRGEREGAEPSFTFPRTEDITREEVATWSKAKKTAFLSERCIIDPDVVVECKVRRPDGRPCGARFSHGEISDARTHFTKTHIRKRNGLIACPWPGCTKKCKGEVGFGRHLGEEHWGVKHQCPFCPCAPIARSDSLFRHMRDSCENIPTHARGESNGQPEAGPSTQQTQPAPDSVESKKRRSRTRASPEQPEAGPSQKRKRSRRCMEEEEWEAAPEEVSESDDDTRNHSDWAPTKADRKGKGKARGPKRRKR